jgi:hypothetical protein
VISYALWTMFGSPADIVGQSLRVGQRSYAVAAVACFRGLRLGRTLALRGIQLDAIGQASDDPQRVRKPQGRGCSRERVAIRMRFGA